MKESVCEFVSVHADRLDDHRPGQTTPSVPWGMDGELLYNAYMVGCWSVLDELFKCANVPIPAAEE